MTPTQSVVAVTVLQASYVYTVFAQKELNCRESDTIAGESANASATDHGSGGPLYPDAGRNLPSQGSVGTPTSAEGSTADLRQSDPEAAAESDVSTPKWNGSRDVRMNISSLLLFQKILLKPAPFLWLLHLRT